MIIQEIILKGFGSYRDLTHIKIPLGLTGIVGSYCSNEVKSVGAGKTTIVSALNYAFFGKGEFDKIEEIINDQLSPKDGFFVKVIFSQGNTVYEVERGKNPDSYLEFTENGISRGDPKIDKRTEEIQKVIGMDYQMFTASIFFEQDRLNKLVDTDPSTRRNYIEKVLGIDIWSSASKLIIKDKNSIKKDLESLSESISSLNLLINDYTIQIANLEDISKDLSCKEIRKQELLEKLTSLQDFKNNKELLRDYTSEKHVIETKKQYYSSKLEQLALQDANDAKELLPLEKKLVICNQDLLKIKQERTKLKVDLDIVNTAVEKLNEEIHSLTSDLAGYNVALNHLRQLKKELKEGICPTCTQEISKEFIIAKHLSLDKEIKYIVDNINNIFEKQAFLKQEIDNLNQKNLKILLTDKDKILDNLINEETILSKQISTITSRITTKDSLHQEFSEHLKELEEKEKFIDLKIIELEKLLTSPISIEILSDLEKESREIEESINKLHQDIGRLNKIREDLVVLQTEKDLKEKDLKEKEQEFSISKILEEEFTKIPSSILTSSVSCIEKEAGNIIHSFFPEMNIIVQEDLTKVNKPLQVFFTIDGKRRNYKRLSGGQRTIANLALRLGFSKVISSRVGVQLNFLILDEPFAFLDNHNREIVKKILMELKKSFSQIIVISHVDNIQDFPNLIKVMMGEDGVSRISTN